MKIGDCRRKGTIGRFVGKGEHRESRGLWGKGIIGRLVTVGKGDHRKIGNYGEGDHRKIGDGGERGT